MLKFRRPVLSILSAILICALLMVSFPVLDTLINSGGPSSGTSEVLADDGCEGCSDSYQESIKAKVDWENCADGDEAWCYQRYLAAGNRFVRCYDQGCDTGIPTGDQPPTQDSGGEPDPCLRGYEECVWVWEGYDECLKKCQERYNACKPEYEKYKILSEKYGKCLESITRCDVPESLVFHGLTAEEYLEKCCENYDACKPTCNGDSECLKKCEKQYDDCIKAYDEYITSKAECDAEYQSFCEGDPESLLQKVIAANNKYLPLSTDSTCTAEAEDTEPVNPDIVSISIIPREITLPQNYPMWFRVEAKTAEGERYVLSSREQKQLIWSYSIIDGPPLEIDQDGLVSLTGFPGRYKVWVKYGDLEAEQVDISTVSPETEPCCPSNLPGCEGVWDPTLWAIGGPPLAFPKGDLNEIIRLYRENIPLGHYWERVFFMWETNREKVVSWTTSDGLIVTWDQNRDKVFSWPESSGITEEVINILRAVDYWETTHTDYPDYLERYERRWEEFSKRLKELRSYNLTAPGKVNNAVLCPRGGKWWSGNKYSCGGYQGQVLEFLDSIKFNKDPKISSLLNGYDYGAIQAPLRVLHQGVVIYPKGTNWKETGIVLDPWPTQYPKIYSVAEFGGYYSPVEPSLGGNDLYPTHGHAYMYNLFGPKPKTTIIPRQKQVIIESPVDALIVNKQGQRIGKLSDGSLAFEIDLAGLMLEPKDDGTKSWYFSLPAGDYTLSLTGTGSGEVRIMTRVAADSANVYRFEIASGEEATLELFDSNPKAPLVLADGKEVLSTTHEIVEEGVEKPTNRPPAASFSIMPENPEVGDYIVVTSTSSDPDGDMLTYSWYVDGVGRFGNSPNWEWENPEAGEHTIKLVVEDSRGGSDEHFMEMNVRKGLPPQQLFPIPLLFFGVAGVAGLAALALLIFLLVTRRRPAPAAPPVIQPEELVSRRPPARPEGPPERLGGGKPSGPPETLD